MRNRSSKTIQSSPVGIDVVNLYGGSIPISENIDAVCDTLDEHIPTGGRCF